MIPLGSETGRWFGGSGGPPPPIILSEPGELFRSGESEDDPECTKPLGASVCSVDSTSGAGTPKSPKAPVMEPVPDGGLNEIGPAIAGKTARSRHDNATSGRTTACIFITAHPSSCNERKKQSPSSGPRLASRRLCTCNPASQANQLKTSQESLEWPARYAVIYHQRFTSFPLIALKLSKNGIENGAGRITKYHYQNTLHSSVI
jgi:hypothetical protein